LPDQRSRPLPDTGGRPDDHRRPGTPGPARPAPPILREQQVIGVGLDEQLYEHRVHGVPPRPTAACRAWAAVVESRYHAVRYANRARGRCSPIVRRPRPCERGPGPALGQVRRSAPSRTSSRWPAGAGRLWRRVELQIRTRGEDPPDPAVGVQVGRQSRNVTSLVTGGSSRLDGES
jgi:hypothetical protein